MILRNPKFGNIYTTDGNVLIRRTLGGELITFKSSHWPTVESFQVSFEALSDDQKEALKDFYISNFGQEVEFTDHEDNVWTGMITSQSLLLTRSKLSCGWEGGFTFEGTRL